MPISQLGRAIDSHYISSRDITTSESMARFIEDLLVHSLA
jgi:hypothetical protein